MKARNRNILRGVTRAPGRFLAILGIITLGSGFLVGLRVSKDAIIDTAARYLTGSGFYDFQVSSTLGLTEEDVDAFSALEGVETAVGAYSADAIVEGVGDSEVVLKFHSVTDGVNEVTLSEGRMPENAGECVVDEKLSVEIGDVITLSPGEGDEWQDSFAETTFTVVGICNSPLYMNYERGTTSLGSGALSGFAYVTEDAFSVEAYTAVYIRMADMPEPYSDEYDTAADEAQERVEALADERAQLRYDDILSDAQAELADGEEEYAEGLEDYNTQRADAEEELADAAAELDDALAQIEDAREQIAEGREELAEQVAAGEEELADAEATLASSKATLDSSEQEYADGKARLEQGQAEYDAGLAEWQAGQEQLTAAETELETASETLQNTKAQLDTLAAVIAAASQGGAAGVPTDAAELAAALQSGDTAAISAVDGLLGALSALDASLPGSAAELTASLDALAQAQAAYDEQYTAWEAQDAALDSAKTTLDGTKAQLDALVQAILTADTAGTYADAGTLLAALRDGDADAAALAEPVLAESGLSVETLLESYDSYETSLREWQAGQAELAAAETQLNAAGETLQATQESLYTLTGLLGGAMAGAGTTAYDSGDALLAALQAGDSAAAAAADGVLGVLSGLSAELPGDAASLTEACAEWQQGQASYEQSLGEYQTAVTQSETAKAQLDAAQETLDQQWAALAEARAQLDAGWEEYNAGLAEVQSGWAELSSSKAEGEQTLAESQEELDDAQAEYEQGVLDYNDAKAEADEEFADAEAELADARQELDDAQDEIDDIEYPTVYILTRNENVGYACLESDASIVEGVSRVFPLFFFLVAALICMTTITRMVEEERGQTGVMMTLGYSRRAIAKKYMMYSGVATVLGCVVGITLGSLLMPQMIWKAYTIMYSFAERLDVYFGVGLSVATLAAYLASMLLVTWASCRGNLSQMPAAVLRPRTPKEGKRVLLERVPFIWNRLSFMGKVSVRNIFRYKQRAWMMILGIGGCMALILTGYGIRDSIQNIADYQYDEITLYDYEVTFSDPLTAQGQEDFTAACGKDASGTLFLSVQNAYISAGDGEKEVYLSAVGQTEEISRFISFHEGETELAFPETGGALINSGLAKTMDLAVGDSITVRCDDGRTLALTVTGVYDNYIYNYVYISQDTCLDQWGEEAEVKTAFVLRGEDADDDAVTARLLGLDDVLNVTASSALRERIGNMMSSLIYIVLLTVVCAAGLALIVIYNLTNINITERLREIATVKVLGFHPGETAAYVLRENVLLTILGIVAGVPMGVVLNAYVIAQIRIDMVSFTARIGLVSYLIAVALTLLFSVLADLLMLRKLSRIDMAAALKAAE